MSQIGRELHLTLQAAVREAISRRHAYVTVEHLLFALLHDERGLEIIRHELDITMAFCGHTDIRNVDSRILLPGHGLDNLRARLEVLFADRAKLAFDEAAVRMEVPA